MKRDEIVIEENIEIKQKEEETTNMDDKLDVPKEIDPPN
jgi:hypothetical protein